MSLPRYKVTWKTLLLPIIGLAAFFIYIYFFVDFSEIIEAIQRINLFYYVLATIVSLLDVFFFALAWYFLLRFLSVKISIMKSFAFVWLGIFVDTLIPGESISGEVAKIYLVNREVEGTGGQATASVVAQRLIGMGINIVTLLVGAFLLLIGSLLSGIMLGMTLLLVAMICVFFALVLLLSFKEAWTLRIVDGVINFIERISRGRWKLTPIRGEVAEMHKAFHVAIKAYLHAPRTLLIASSFSVISWLFSMSVLYLTLLSIGYVQISWSAILVISGIFVGIKSVPIGIPFEVGLPEFTLTALLYSFSVPKGVSETATILMRLLTLWLRFFIGFGVQQWIGVKAIITGSDTETGSTLD